MTSETDRAADDPAAQTGELHRQDTGTPADEGSGVADAAAPDTEPPSERSFGWRGWVLVAVVVVSFLVVPWAIVLLPSAQGFLGSLGLGLRDAYLVLPLVPALLLGGVAIWTAVRNRERRRYR